MKNDIPMHHTEIGIVDHRLPAYPAKLPAIGLNGKRFYVEVTESPWFDHNSLSWYWNAVLDGSWILLRMSEKDAYDVGSVPHIVRESLINERSRC